MITGEKLNLGSVMAFASVLSICAVSVIVPYAVIEHFAAYMPKKGRKGRGR